MQTRKGNKTQSVAARRYSRPAERGLSESGGGWNLKQASAWSGIGENYLRKMVKNGEIPVAYFIGRRVLLPREGFKDWFNRRTGEATLPERALLP
jgi:excisionase family DNA binding protein